MNNRIIPASEFVINADGSAFHLHLKPGQIADHIILVGDRERVNMVASNFDADSIECDVCNREFHTITGRYNGHRISCLSHGIGAGNIDIVMTELDALVNIDFSSRQEKQKKTQLTLVRVGTSGGLQSSCPVGSYVVAKRSIGFDGLLDYYQDSEGVFDLDFENKLCMALNWNPRLPRPYTVNADADLAKRIADNDMILGTTISAPGFYGPQGRYLRLTPIDPDINAKIEKFSYNGEQITNYEMESAAVAGMAQMMGHRAMTVCDIIAGRVDKTMNTEYHGSMEKLVKTVLSRMWED